MVAAGPPLGTKSPKQGCKPTAGPVQNSAYRPPCPASPVSEQMRGSFFMPHKLIENNVKVTTASLRPASSCLASAWRSGR